MELDQLRYFLKVAETKNFSRAAEELLLSQPALSRSVAKLEEEIGQPVFERQSRIVALTDAGRILHARALQILGLVDDTKREIVDDGVSGSIRLGAIPTIAPFWVPRLIAGFQKQFPQTKISLREEVTERLIQSVNHSEVDAAILALPLEAGYMTFEKIFDEELKLAIPSIHPLAKRRSIDARSLDHEAFLMLGEGHCLSEQIEAFCRRRSIASVAMEKTSQIATLLELVSLGQGIAFVPEMACQTDPQRRRVYRSMSGPVPRRTIVYLRNPYRYESKLQLAFRKFVVATQ